jgi:hypothetical protein
MGFVIKIMSFILVLFYRSLPFLHLSYFGLQQLYSIVIEPDLSLTFYPFSIIISFALPLSFSEGLLIIIHMV